MAISSDNVFADLDYAAWPHRYEGTLRVGTIAGGTPSDPKVAEAWIRAKAGITSEEQIQQEVAAVMLARAGEPGFTLEKAAAEVNANKNLNGFKKDEKGLYIEGRQLKAAIREAVNVAYSAGKFLNSKGVNSWGKTSKGIHGFMAEHVVVEENRLYLGVDKPTDIMQRFVHTFRGSGIQYEEYVEGAEIDFTIRADYEFTREQWGMIWLTGAYQGIGASRSQGFGVYEVIKWNKLELPA